MGFCSRTALVVVLGAAACGGQQDVRATWLMPSLAQTDDPSGRPARAARGLPWSYGPAGDDAFADEVSDESEPSTAGSRRAGLWLYDERDALAEARESGRGVVIDFSASWCTPCVLLERDTLGDPLVRSELGAYFVALRVDVTEDDRASRALLERYRVAKLPAIVVLDTQGHEIDRIEAYLDAEAFLERLARARTNAGGVRLTEK